VTDALLQCLILVASVRRPRAVPADAAIASLAAALSGQEHLTTPVVIATRRIRSAMSHVRVPETDDAVAAWIIRTDEPVSNNLVR
jgi:hypothetical protein